jgi:hypothetical protein
MSDEKLMDEPTATPVDKLMEEPADQIIEKSIEQLAEKTTETSTEESVEKNMDSPTEVPAEKASESASENPNERIVENSIEETPEREVEELIEKPTESISISATGPEQEETTSLVEGSRADPEEDNLESAAAALLPGSGTDIVSCDSWPVMLCSVISLLLFSIIKILSISAKKDNMLSICMTAGKARTIGSEGSGETASCYTWTPS